MEINYLQGPSGFRQRTNRHQMKFLQSTLSVSFLVAHVAALASSPAGEPPKTAREAYEKAAVVFLGEVSDTKKDQFGFESIATVQVQKIFKGSELLKRSATVIGTGGPTYPARLFKKGQTLLFYTGTDLRADSYMNRVTDSKDAWADVASFPKK